MVLPRVAIHVCRFLEENASTLEYAARARRITNQVRVTGRRAGDRHTAARIPYTAYVGATLGLREDRAAMAWAPTGCMCINGYRIPVLLVMAVLRTVLRAVLRTVLRTVKRGYQ